MNDNITLYENKLTAEQFCDLQESLGFGRPNEIVSKLIQYIKGESIFDTNIMVGLMAAKGKEAFYEKMGFRIRPNEREGNGMMMNI